jgi:hypothetical protein
VRVTRHLMMLGLIVAELALVGGLAFSDARQDAPPAESLLVNPSQITFEHDGRDVTGFALYLRRDAGEWVRFDLGALRPDGTGQISAKLPPLSDGDYTMEVAAYDRTAESPHVAANPGRFRITGSTRQDAAATSSTAAPPVASPGPADPPPTSPPDASTNSTPKRGILGRLWILVVGDDAK